ncbi:NAD(P)/FAD-dependent oxidoreductase [Methanopyrus sp.]
MTPYDVIVIGAGPAGLSAAIHAARAGVEVLVVAQELGGQLATAPEVGNYPGFPPAPGYELVERMVEHAETVGVELNVKYANRVEEIELTDDTFRVLDEECRAVVIATGARPKRLGIPGERELEGRGVSYCAICDGPAFQNRTVAVIGRGTNAANTALFLSEIAERVHVITPDGKLESPDRTLIERVLSRRNVEVIRGEVRRIVGSERVEGVELSDGDILPCEGVFIAAGKVPNSEPFQDLVETDDHGYIVVDGEMRTSLEGVYSAGDVTTVPHRNLPSAVYQGSVAGINAAEYALRSR